MAGEADARRFAESNQQKVALRRALCVAVNPQAGMAQFNVNGGTQSAPMMVYPPTPGLDAWLLYVGDIPLCLGPVYRSPWGAVAAVPASGKVQILGDDGETYVIPYANSLTLALNDRVAIDWASGVVTSEPASEQEDVTPIEPGGGTRGEERTWTFYPTDSGSFGSSWFNPRVYCSDSNVGCYFYEGIADTIPDDATIKSVSLFLSAEQALYADSTIGLHDLTGKTGPPSISSAVAVPRGTGDKGLPTAFGDALKTGAMKGLGTAHGGYSIYSPAGVNNSGALTIVAQLNS